MAVALVWIWIFNPRLGILNYTLKQIGIQGPPWIFSKTWVKPSLILMSMFSVGPNMIILLAGLQGVPKELYESAEIDGAGHWAKFRNVTLPMLSPVLFFVIIISVVSSFQNFTEIRVMTEGGPGESSNVLIWYLWENAFIFLQLGVAAGCRLDHVCHSHGIDGHPVPRGAALGSTTRPNRHDQTPRQKIPSVGSGRSKGGAQSASSLLSPCSCPWAWLLSCLSLLWYRPRLKPLNQVFAFPAAADTRDGAMGEFRRWLVWLRLCQFHHLHLEFSEDHRQQHHRQFGLMHAGCVCLRPLESARQEFLLRHRAGDHALAQ